MQTKEQERLTQLVKDGKITEEQKNLILKKQEELRSERESNRDSFENLTPEERRVQMQEKRSELEKWATENGIDADAYLMHFGGRGEGNFGGPRIEGNNQ